MCGRTREENKCRRGARGKESGYEDKKKPAKGGLLRSERCVCVPL